MKKLLLCAALLLPTVVSAEVCNIYYEMAESIMKARQSLVPIIESMEIAESIGNDNFIRITKEIVVDAYSKPAFSSDDGKRRIIEEFANKYYLRCIKS